MAGIYIHIPFCAQACYYCDFHFSTSLKMKTKVISAMEVEICKQRNYLNNATIETIYLGGGTPSLIGSDSIQMIFEKIKQNFKISDAVEFTIEANPEDITKELVQKWINVGINRISLGVQAFNNEHLSYMNRIHDAQQSINSLEILTQSKISNISIDLIYGYPLLSDIIWEEALDTVIKYNPKHISCYCLTVEKETPLFHLIKKGIYSNLNIDQERRQFLIARKKLMDSGYHHYEISNFAKPGFESKHNTNYWNKTHYLGIGPSAHSFNGITRQWNVKNNIQYCNSLEKSSIYYEVEELTKKNIINEYILTSLRTSSGMKMEFFSSQMNSSEFKKFSYQINKLEKSKLILNNNDIISCTESGMLMVDSISSHLFLI